MTSSSPPRVIIYTAVYCSYCWRARRVLERLGIEHEVRDITVDYAERKRLTDETGRRTLPNVFIDGTSVGGHDELVAMAEAGKLDYLRS